MLRKTVRYGGAIGIGAAVTFGLLFVMQYMIRSGQNPLDNHARVSLVDFIRVERTPVVDTREPKTDKPPPPPTIPDLTEVDPGHFGDGIKITFVTPPVDVGPARTGLDFGVSDGEYLPIVKVAAIYPPRAQTLGLEGYVVVEYTVTTDGSTRDVTAIESTSPLFERAAVESAQKYKYKPRIIDGTPVEVPGVTTKIVFEFAD